MTNGGGNIGRIGATGGGCNKFADRSQLESGTF